MLKETYQRRYGGDIATNTICSKWLTRDTAGKVWCLGLHYFCVVSLSHRAELEVAGLVHWTAWTPCSYVTG